MEALHIDVSTHRRLHTHTHSHTHACSHRKPPHAIFSQTRAFHAQQNLAPRSCWAQKLLHTDAFTHMFLHANNAPALFHRGFGTRVPLHKAHESFYTQLLPTNVFAHRSFCAYASTHSTGKRLSTQQLLRKKTLYTHTQMLLHKSIYIRKAPTHGKLYTGGPLQTGFYLQKLLHTGAGTMHGSKKVEAACIWYICFGQALRIE